MSGKGSDWVLEGDLTVHGVTKPVTVELELDGVVEKDPWGFSRAAYSGSAEIDREDFGLTWNATMETGGLLVGKTVKLSLEVETVKQSTDAWRGMCARCGRRTGNSQGSSQGFPSSFPQGHLRRVTARNRGCGEGARRMGGGSQGGCTLGRRGATDPGPVSPRRSRPGCGPPPAPRPLTSV